MSRLYAIHGCLLVLCALAPLSACDDGKSADPKGEDAGPDQPVTDAGPSKPVDDAGPTKPAGDAGSDEPNEDAGPDLPPCYAPTSPEPFEPSRCEQADGALTCTLCVGTCVYDASGVQNYALQCGPGAQLLDIESYASSPDVSASECPTLYRLGGDERYYLAWQDIWTAHPEIPCAYPGEPVDDPMTDGGTLGPSD